MMMMILDTGEQHYRKPITNSFSVVQELWKKEEVEELINVYTSKIKDMTGRFLFLNNLSDAFNNVFY